MFGYIRPNEGNLLVKELELYKAADKAEAIGKVKDEIMRATSYRGVNIIKRTR